MLLEVQGHTLRVGEFELTVRHGKTSERDAVLQVIQVVQGAFNVKLEEVCEAALGRVGLVVRLLLLIDHDQCTYVVGNALYFGHTPIRLLDQVEVLVDILEL